MKKTIDALKEELTELKESFETGKKIEQSWIDAAKKGVYLTDARGAGYHDAAQSSTHKSHIHVSKILKTAEDEQKEMIDKISALVGPDIADGDSDDFVKHVSVKEVIAILKGEDKP